MPQTRPSEVMREMNGPGFFLISLSHFARQPISAFAHFSDLIELVDSNNTRVCPARIASRDFGSFLMCTSGVMTTHLSLPQQSNQTGSSSVWPKCMSWTSILKPASRNRLASFSFPRFRSRKKVGSGGCFEVVDRLFNSLFVQPVVLGQFLNSLARLVAAG